MRLGILLVLMLATTLQAVILPDRPPDHSITIPTSAYCSCGYCCGWHYYKGMPVTRSGKRKCVGLTATGTQASHGTVAVDMRVFPKGTIFYIPGYGYGIACDKGSAVKGRSIELWFASHRSALQWGRRRREVLVWLPKP